MKKLKYIIVILFLLIIIWIAKEVIFSQENTVSDLNNLYEDNEDVVVFCLEKHQNRDMVLVDFKYKENKKFVHNIHSYFELREETNSMVGEENYIGMYYSKLEFNEDHYNRETVYFEDEKVKHERTKYKISYDEYLDKNAKFKNSLRGIMVKENMVKLKENTGMKLDDWEIYKDEFSLENFDGSKDVYDFTLYYNSNQDKIIEVYKLLEGNYQIYRYSILNEKINFSFDNENEGKLLNILIDYHNKFEEDSINLNYSSSR